jgi:hypothetical protein
MIDAIPGRCRYFFFHILPTILWIKPWEMQHGQHRTTSMRMNELTHRYYPITNVYSRQVTNDNRMNTMSSSSVNRLTCCFVVAEETYA